jgi:hypothetical protein
MRLDVIWVGEPYSRFQPSHVSAAGSRATTALVTTAANALRGGHLALTVGSVQQNTMPKESRGVGCRPISFNTSAREASSYKTAANSRCVHNVFSSSKTLENNESNCPHPFHVHTRTALWHRWEGDPKHHEQDK